MNVIRVSWVSVALVAFAGVVLLFSTTEAQDNITGKVVPGVVIQPESVTLPEGEKTELFVEKGVEGLGDVAYQWYVSLTADTIGGKPLSGEVGRVCEVTGISGTVYYFVIVTNALKDKGVAETVSNVVRVSNSPVRTDAVTPVISFEPQNVSVELGRETMLSVSALADDGGVLNYRWLKNADADGYLGWDSIEAATNASFVPPTSRIGKIYYKVVVTNVNTEVLGKQTASIESVPVAVVVSGEGVKNAQFPVLSGPWRGVDVGGTNPAELVVAAESPDGGILSYQWFKTTSSNNVEGVSVSGATDSVFVPGPDYTKNAVYYYVEVTNTNTGVNGETVATTVSKPVQGIGIVTGIKDVQTRDRRIPQTAKNVETAVLAPVKSLSVGFDVGPNPVDRGHGVIGFFRQGERVKKASLAVYDASGIFVKKVVVNDEAVDKRLKRQVGSWNLTNKKGFLVSEGAYLVKGTIKTVDKKTEKIALLISVR